MDTLIAKNNTLSAVINGLLEKIKIAENQIDKNLMDKTYILRSIDSFDKDLLEIDRISQENKSIYYRFVPLNENLFVGKDKGKFRDQYHKIGNLIHSCLFSTEDLKDVLSGDCFDKNDVLKFISNIQNNIENIDKLFKEINEVAYKYVDPNKDIHEILLTINDENRVIKVLIVDDESSWLYVAQRFLDKRGFKTFIASKEDEALKSLKENSPDIILLDLNLDSVMGGLQILKFIRENALPIKCIVDTVVDDVDRLRLVNEFKPEKILLKPFDNNQLLSQINAVIQGSKT